MKKLKIYNHACDQCLFTDNKIVPDERAQEVIEQALASDSWFECRKGTLQGQNIVCRGFWNKHKKDSLATRLALMLNMFEFVEISQED